MAEQNYPQDPLALFRIWLRDAERSEPNDPNAMCLATAGADGQPHARMVLLKGLDPRGFIFYTNTESDKGVQLAQNTKAALCFHWKTLRKQVRIEGLAEAVTPAEADVYFASRPRGSRIGAWVSQQSRPLESRAALESALKDREQAFGDGDVPRPAYWSGYRVIPQRIEFWKDESFRLHRRMVYTRAGKGWKTGMVYP